MSWLSEAIGMVFDPGKSSRDQAQALNEQSLASQQGQEAWQRGLLQDRLDLSNQFLYGGNVQNPAMAGADGVNASPGTDVVGALPQAQDWEARFFNYLEKSPDTTYNAQRGALEKGIKDAQSSVASNLNRRGLSGSALGASQYGNLGLDRARGLSQLEGERIGRQGENIAKGAQLSSSILDRALNMGNAASGMVSNFNTQIPGMLSSQANQAQSQANQAGSGIGGELIAQGAQSAFDRLFPTKQTTTSNGASAGGWGQTLVKGAISGLTGGLF